MVDNKNQAANFTDQMVISSDVSVIVCVRNGEKIIGDCLSSTLKNNPKEIILVDGCSTDNTVSIAKSFDKVKVVSDQGKGLAYARRIGIENAAGNFILFVGPDNIMDDNFIANFVMLKKQWGFHAASVQTIVFEPKTYWDRGLNFRWKCLMGKPGPLKVVGTPSLYDASLFNEVKFSEKNMGPNDDTDVAEQLTGKGYKLGLIPLTVYDQNGWDAKTTWNRFKWYGTGDFYYYNKYKSTWHWKRKIYSMTHPLRQTWSYTLRALKLVKLSPIPWLVYTMIARYYGWISLSLKAK
jgi:glycosyltransferase involved in cell wall biosynthesis